MSTLRALGGLVAALSLGAAGMSCGSGATASGATGMGAGGDAGHPMPDAGPDAGGPMGDSLPASAVSFFQGTACPVGWAPFTAADGRFLVPTVATSPGGVTAGTPLASGEDRTHTHAVAATFTLGSTAYFGASGGDNGGVTPDGTVTMKTTSDPASTGLPYVQLLTCRKDAPAVPRTTPLPHGMQMFFDMAGCPEGWKQTATTQGRLIVGLPQGAPQDVTFGGAVLSSADGGADTRTHTHGNTATFSTTAHGILLASGSLSDNYGANGTYTASMATGQADTGLPYIELLSCEKQ